MSSVYGDLILQDGARIINKSGVEYGGQTRRFNLNVRVSTSATNTAVATLTVPCVASISNSYVRLDISSFQLPSNASYNATLLAISGIPSDFVSINPNIGGGFIATNTTSLKSFSSGPLSWSTAANTQLITNTFLIGESTTAIIFNVIPISIFYSII
ncbi:hypothetical protein ACTFIR_011880 [Dictyostelium discoideum]